MERKLLEIVNYMRECKGQTKLTDLSYKFNLRDDLDFSSLDLAELTVRVENEFEIDVFENGLVTTVGEIIEKLNKK